MAFLLVPFAAGYVAYTNREKKRQLLIEKSQLYDSRIGCLDSKKSIALDEIDPQAELTFLEYPITTITYYECASQDDFDNFELKIKNRVNLILDRNPWLKGWLIMDTNNTKFTDTSSSSTSDHTSSSDDTNSNSNTKTNTRNYQMKLYYDDDDKDDDDDGGGGDHNKQHYQKYEDTSGLLFDSIKNYKQYGRILSEMDDGSAIVSQNLNLIGSYEKPLWKVSLIVQTTKAQSPTKNDNAENKEENSQQQQQQSQSQDDYKESSSSESTLKFALVVSMSHAIGDVSSFYMLYNMLLLSEDGNKIKSLYPHRPQSLIAAAGPISESDRSNNNAVGSSSTFRDTLGERIGCTQQEVHYLRDALSKPAVDCSGTGDEISTLRMFTVNQAWLEDEQQKHKQQSHDAVSKNSILTSWFFNLNQASIGLMVADLRRRFDGRPILGRCCCDGDGGGLGDDDDGSGGDDYVGNYFHAIPYTPSDYNTPQLIQKSIITNADADSSTTTTTTTSRSLRRCGPLANQYDLPGFMWDMTCSISMNWTNSNYLVCHEQKQQQQGGSSYDHDNIKTCMHVPIFDPQFLRDVIPNRVSCIVLFNTTHNSSSTTAAKEEEELGAIVLCRGSVWNKIKACGIVDQILVE